MASMINNPTFRNSQRQYPYHKFTGSWQMSF